MKKILFIVIALSVFTLNSCEDMDIIQENPKKIAVSTFMTNASEVEGVINAIYFQLRREQCFGRYMMIIKEALADYCYGRGSYAEDYTSGLTSGSIGYVKDTWAVLYRSIRFANQIVLAIPDAQLSEQEYAELTGETRFLRALCYSYLVRSWGGVPLYTEQNMDDFNKPRTPANDIWAYVISELEYAAENLPETASEYGRPTKYSALALLTEAYLYTEDYNNAKNTASTIISSGKYELIQISTSDDFEQIYGPYVTGTTEEIFYIKYNRENGSSFPWMYVANPNPFLGSTGALGIWTDYINNKFIANWDHNDLRYGFNLYVQTKNGTLNSITKTGMICGKYRDPDRPSGSNTSNDFPLYMYSDVLLWYAEAVCRAEGTPNADAMEKINMVHRRAYGYDPKVPSEIDFKLSDYSSAEAFIDLVLKERGYETIFEGKRYDDLKRCGKLEEYVEAAKGITVINDAAYWWPIPSDEFNYNDALDPTTDQNPGY